MIRRTDYTDGKNTFHEYYKQFAHIFLGKIKAKYQKEEWARLLKEDKHLNNVPLAYWDRLADGSFVAMCRTNLEINGTCSASLSDSVCAAKTAVRIYVEEE